jgi:hypothetical protein
VSENRLLRRIFGPKREGVAGDWRKLLNEELHNLYATQNIITLMKCRRMRGAGHVTRMGEVSNAHQIFVDKSERKRSFGRPRRKW